MRFSRLRRTLGSHLFHILLKAVSGDNSVFQTQYSGLCWAFKVSVAKSLQTSGYTILPQQFHAVKPWGPDDWVCSQPGVTIPPFLLSRKQYRDSYTSPLQILLAELCAIASRISPLESNKNVPFSQICLVLIFVLCVGEFPYIYQSRLHGDLGNLI